MGTKDGYLDFGLRDQAGRHLEVVFPCVDEAQRLREIVLDSLDQEQDDNGLARHAYRSRTQFCRVFRTMIDGTPFAMRLRRFWKGWHGSCLAPISR